MTDSSLELGRQLIDKLNPGMEETLEHRYGNIVPGIGESVVDFAYGQQYARPGLDLKSRYIATLTALGGQTGSPWRCRLLTLILDKGCQLSHMIIELAGSGVKVLSQPVD